MVTWILFRRNVGYLSSVHCTMCTSFSFFPSTKRGILKFPCCHTIQLPRIRHSVLSSSSPLLVRDRKYGPPISQQRLLESKKFKKRGAFIFEFWLWEYPPHPVNWSPTHSTGPQNPFFYRYLSNGRSNPKNSQNEVHLFSNFGSGRTHVRCVRV